MLEGEGQSAVYGTCGCGHVQLEVKLCRLSIPIPGGGGGGGGGPCIWPNTNIVGKGSLTNSQVGPNLNMGAFSQIY